MNKYILYCLIFFGVLVTTLCFSQDCVPTTFCRIFPSVDYTSMCKLCHTSSDGTIMLDAINSYPKLSTNKLECVYSRIKTIPSKDQTIDTNKPYLWIGTVNDGYHCALIKFQETNVMVSNSNTFIKGTTNYYVFYYDYPTFFKNTYCLFTSKDINSNIRMK